MTLLVQLLALLLGIGWIIWSVAPVLPWPLLSFAGIFVLQRFTPQERSSSFLLIMSWLTVLSMITDYVLPLMGTKKYGGTNAWVRWWTFGLIIWFFVVPPVWLLVGPLLWAFLGERWQKKDTKHARRAARGSFVGSTLSTIIKLIISIIHTRYIIQAIW